MSKSLRVVAAVALMLTFSSAMAQRGGGFDTNKLFFGAGLSQNELPGPTDEATGFQFFGGYEFGAVARDVYFDLEVGYMNSGDFDVCTPFGCFEGGDVSGLWATGVGRLKLSPQFELLGRAGLDFGDDDGFMFGIGAGFAVNRQTSLRLEYVERDHLESLQFNFVYRP